MAACAICRGFCPEGASKCPSCGTALAGLFETEETVKSGPRKAEGGTLLFESPSSSRRTSESAVQTTPPQPFAESVETNTGEDDPLIGQTPLGQYYVLKKAGEGGFGAVYIAEQIGVGRKAVIKVLRKRHLDSEQFIRRFEREAAVLATLDHHNLVRLYNFGELPDGQLFLAMEYGGDRTLAAEICQHGRLLPERALLIAGQVCDALQEAHERGIVHRDLKPHNILLGEKSGGDWAKVVDMGIAKILDTAGPGLSDSAITAQGAMVGTPAYFSPEQARGLPVDARSDIYAMGVVLFEMLTATLPIRGVTPIDFVRAHSSDAPLAIKDAGVHVPSFIEAIVSRALEKDPARRFRNAREMGEAIAGARRRLCRRPADRRRLLLGAGILGAVAGAVIVPIALEKTREAEQPLSAQIAAPLPRPGAISAPLPAPTAMAAARQPPTRPLAALRPSPALPKAPPPSPANKKALKLIREAGANGIGLEDAVDKLGQALDEEPGGKVKAQAYRALAGLYEDAGERALALRYYQLLLPYCAPEDLPKVRAKIDRLK